MAPRCRAAKLREPSQSGRAVQYFHAMCSSSRSDACARDWNTPPRKSASAAASCRVVGPTAHWAIHASMSAPLEKGHQFAGKNFLGSRGLQSFAISHKTKPRRDKSGSEPDFRYLRYRYGKSGSDPDFFLAARELHRAGGAAVRMAE